MARKHDALAVFALSFRNQRNFRARPPPCEFDADGKMDGHQSVNRCGLTHTPISSHTFDSTQAGSAARLISVGARGSPKIAKEAAKKASQVARIFA